MTKLVSRFLKDESGATAIEYGLIAALISVALITGATALGGKLNNLFNGLSNKMNSACGTGNMTC
ncbi:MULTISPECIES: Flp family type IVb pilin [unclassified Rhizobium]|uniref:Flp family type IVb pilin n=1 Tax=unclassified Rhizobium TaxID=2613769 RepID=UPI0002715C88|nr:MULTISPECIES: Flp family type IVb pilin [unclassified Rhizobium]EJL52058.1 Flp pilus assembly protein, pilin Flp [Rhizobium sp. CF122]MBB4166784.1 pilus assembly protein Flp/PilA [Rhizobium sp. BK538]MBZ9789664.1 Flp family type IVb pilin [Rhizobium sp. 3T7]TCM77510.1 pilus assembly protein Flp/PilA [Rhizobium sp. BK068]